MTCRQTERALHFAVRESEVKLDTFFMFLFGEIIDRASQPSRTKKNVFEMDEPMVSSEWINDLVQDNEWICAVDDSYLSDNFNLYGLSNEVKDYADLIKIIRGTYYDYASPQGSKQRRAESLYALVHARFLLTVAGAQRMKKKYDKKIYGVCPRVACNEQALLPIGLSPVPGDMNAKTFCPCCQDLYEASCAVDGAYFGPYFPHFFLHAMKGELQVQARSATPVRVLGVPAEGSVMNRSSLIHNERDWEEDMFE